VKAVLNNPVNGKFGSGSAAKIELFGKICYFERGKNKSGHLALGEGRLLFCAQRIGYEAVLKK